MCFRASGADRISRRKQLLGFAGGLAARSIRRRGYAAAVGAWIGVVVGVARSSVAEDVVSMSGMTSC